MTGDSPCSAMLHDLEVVSDVGCILAIAALLYMLEDCTEFLAGFTVLYDASEQLPCCLSYIGAVLIARTCESVDHIGFEQRRAR